MYRINHEYTFEFGLFFSLSYMEGLSQATFTSCPELFSDAGLFMGEYWYQHTPMLKLLTMEHLGLL